MRSLLIASALIILGAGVVFGLAWRHGERRSRTSDAGIVCPNGVRWHMPDDGACWRECVRAATSNSGFYESATRFCVRNTCEGYEVVCK